MWNSIKPILAQLFGSKKFLAMLAGALVFLLAKSGVVLSEQDVMPIIVLVGTYIGAQGLSDIGKGRAEIESRTMEKLAAAGQGQKLPEDNAEDPPRARGKK